MKKLKIPNKCIVFIFLVIFWVLLPCLVNAGQFIAYSLNEAERRFKESSRSNSELTKIGGITKLIGVVYDKATKDLIIVGQVNEGEQGVTLDDFVVALRAILHHKTWPLVSIDKTEKTEKTDMQEVRFEGGIAGTKFGKDLFEADVYLKKIGLGKIQTNIWGVESYFDMFVEYWENTEIENNIRSRFWFKADKEASSFADREGVVVVKRLKVYVDTELMNTRVNGKSSVSPNNIRDEVGEKFAAVFSTNYDDISYAYPAINRVNTLFNLVGMATGIQILSFKYPAFKPNMDFWLNKYKVSKIETPEYYPILMQEAVVHKGEKTRRITVDGGIELKSLILELNDGSITALRDIVIKSKPEGNPLIWRVPLEGWHSPYALESDIYDMSVTNYDQKNYSVHDKLGCSLTGQFSSVDTPYKPWMDYRSTTLPTGMPKFTFTDRLDPQRYSSNVGGVMLQDVAQIVGDAKANLTGGNFSLVVDGENARISPDTFSKFITALWSVYYCKEDPGISIDPIAPGAKKHLVRYIGQVINNDLGRVMREADYLMKKWAVGTERANIPGFENPDDIAARMGVVYIGAMSRFWFVPEGMKFRSGRNMLLFEDGRMTVKTEFMFKNKGMRADPANEKFAQFFTEHYEEIAEKYPVYEELFEYAKLVSLAKYLKENGVPLYWFLMANKDLVLTEDSPGTVDALAKGSDYFRGIHIEGGVNLRSQGKFVYDQQAIKAIKDAMSKLPTNIYAKTKLSSDEKKIGSNPERFSFDLGKDSYTVIPQHSLTSGKDRYGIRYQTDIALRNSIEPGLELVRFYNPKKQQRGEFGKGWHLLVPYRIMPEGQSKRKFLNAIIPEKMSVENLITGEKEVLTFSTDRYAIAGYVPDDLEKSQVIGLFIMSDASYRLADKIGNEFWFDQAGYLTDMKFSEDNSIHYEYNHEFIENFEKPLYRIESAGNERVKFLNASIPNRIKVVNLTGDTSDAFIFRTKWGVSGYIPEESKKSRFKIIVLMTDGSFRLLDKNKNEIAFNPAGHFVGLALPPESPRIIKSISKGKQKIFFKYDLDKTDAVRISTAHLFNTDEEDHLICTVHYKYDEEGRLAKAQMGRL